MTNVTLLNPYNPQNFRYDKLSVLDVKAEGIDGKRFNIEIQLNDEADYDKRALYYWGKLYTEQLKKGDSYSDLSKAIGIHILNFISIPKSSAYHNVFNIYEKNSDLLYFKDLELHTIELRKFTDDSNEKLADLIAKIKNSLDMWSAFLTRHDLLIPGSLPPELNNPNLHKALTVLEVMNFNVDEREGYEDHLKYLRMQVSGVKKARIDGLELGEARGMKKGIAIGKLEGINEATTEIAKNLLKSGIQADIVAKFTGLAVR